MANDAQQAERHLANMASEAQLKDDMVRTIISDRAVPAKLQFALSQRLYYQELLKGQLFWVQNDPVCEWLENIGERRRRFLLHWAAYDSQVNLPVIYLMELEDSGKVALPKDERRWPEVQAHLMAQALAGLKLVTIARGLTRISTTSTPSTCAATTWGRCIPLPIPSSPARCTGCWRRRRRLRARTGRWPGRWRSWRAKTCARSARAGSAPWSGRYLRSTRLAGGGADTGATRTQRAIILPQRPFQVLAELDPPGFGDVQKFVVSDAGQVLRVLNAGVCGGSRSLRQEYFWKDESGLDFRPGKRRIERVK